MACVTEYASDRYRYGEWSAAKARADEIVASYPAQSRITVYYRASDPTDAVLKAGPEGMDIFLGMFKRGSKGSTHQVYAPTMVLTDDDGSIRHERLVEWPDAKRAESLAGWLSERIGIKSL